MTSRQTGRRLRKMSVQRKGARQAGRPQAVRSNTNTRQTAGELRRLVQLVACGGIFVLLVAAKLLLPAKMADFNERLSSLMAQNMDVQAVFSAVGRAVSGDNPMDAAEEVYQAVFHPQVQPSVKSRTLRLHDGGALETLQSYRTAEDPPEEATAQTPAETEPESAPENPEEAAGETQPDTEDPANLAYVLYSEENLPEGVSMEQAMLGFDYITPVMGKLTSDFGYREHPIDGEERFHYGVDLAANSGTEMDCFADGSVTAVGESSSYGKYCIVGHEGGYSTLYAHCSRVVVSSGTPVTRGQKIAEVGQTGAATGPHLHFELHQNGSYLNPIYYVAAQ